jgi:hypothetical protein
MKTYCTTVTMLAMTLLLPIYARAQEPPVVVPGTADATDASIEPEWHKIAVREQAAVPFDQLTSITYHDKDGDEYVTSDFIDPTTNPPTHVIGIMGKNGGAQIKPDESAICWPRSGVRPRRLPAIFP